MSLPAFLLLLFVPLTVNAAEPAAPTENPEFSQWIKAFKTSPKGPFKRIRWYCKDGSILPPVAGACAGHGGGIQHGEWNEQTRVLRDAGFYVGNVLAALDINELVASASGHVQLRQVLLERYLMAADDGWIFRGARYYRGALQVEDEVAAARRLLTALARAGQTRQRDFLLLRVAAKLLVHNEADTDIARVRHLSTRLGEQDPGFEKLRNKLHAQPDAADAERIRQYLQNAPRRFRPDYERLAAAIDNAYRHELLEARLAAVAQSLSDRPVAGALRRANAVFNQATPSVRLQTAARLLRLLREETGHLSTSGQWLDLLDASLALEQQVFTAGSELRTQLGAMSRRQRLDSLGHLAMAMYGTGELSQRQWQEMRSALEGMAADEVGLAELRQNLRYLARAPQWVEGGYQFHFSLAVQRLAVIETKVKHFIPDQLRSGPVLHYSAILDGLLIDADRLAGLAHRIFNTTTGSGVRMLNPGLARGLLRIADTTGAQLPLLEDGIYVLPETTAELPPVAGILTLGEGNALSHVQILARNLGIPNVLIQQHLLPVLQAQANRNIVMAVSPGGRVVLAEDGPQWQAILGESRPAADDKLVPELSRLDLSFTALLSLDQLRARDAGRLAGPKAANLGELRQHFPENVPAGIVLPFGVFHAFLQQPVSEGQQSAFNWIQNRYRQLRSLSGVELERERDIFLQQVQAWIMAQEPGGEFRRQLRAALRQQLGSDTDFTLFVRSDTNMEDLPGFSGAGLNRTVPNVKGFEELLTAIKQVWASAFTKRAFAWRQQRMLQPEHIYVSVLLMPSVAVEKSGVMVTTDASNNEPGWVTIAVSEGVGGAVQGEAAEELRLHLASGDVQLLAEATAPLRRVLSDSGGVSYVPVSANPQVLSKDNLQRLRELAETLPARYPMPDAAGEPAALDIEFGFHDDQLVLFQARPYLANRRARQNRYLHALDSGLRATAGQQVRLDGIPRE
ncbi:PEP/pyruvate-binding domain-containing protein [Sulfuriflexus sp.]|uniref:PEP/pyruvate-binding domain-containing protein n=1 Tax=Sulfuriflexus sp. TaxID=2015443 RepID=UPI0028CE15B3|nr:PEP/pyruvate-binding domain-containing protein [Sulfuriflexus sp.]MDT8403243.1 PEP/pyruvate-binding domain-containing protein [Sulfuriflexus sp.]